MTPPPGEANLAANYRDVRQRILSAATVSGQMPPVLIAVSKGHPADSVEALYHLGHRDFGENYVQDLVEKAQELTSRGMDGIRWHFIGHLQSNKVKALLPFVSCIHSVDSEKSAGELAKRWAESGRSGKLDILLEVNIDDEKSKRGIPPADAPAIAQRVVKLAGVSLKGLMCIPAPGSGAQAFVRLRTLEQQCRPATQGVLSMGMSQDYEDAIREGATHVRVGTAIFGERPR